MKKLLLLAAVALATLAVPPKTIAGPWTTACSAGATIQQIDENIYSVVDNYMTFFGTNTGSIVARYNVTNVTNKRFPGWTQLQLGYLDAAGGNVTATLFQWNCLLDQPIPFCTVTSVANPMVQCLTCNFTPLVVDFGGTNIFYVEVTLNRTTAQQDVRAESLRIF